MIAIAVSVIYSFIIYEKDFVDGNSKKTTRLFLALIRKYKIERLCIGNCFH